MKEQLRKAITHEGNAIQRRVEWIQQVIERQTKTAQIIQETIEGFRTQLEAANLALDLLREEYRKIIETGENTGNNDND